MRRLIYILTFIFLISFTGSIFGQNDSQFKRKKESTFKKDGFGKNNSSGTKAAPPPPGGGGGTPVPISGGAFLLAGGLLVYSIYRNRKKDA